MWCSFISLSRFQNFRGPDCMTGSLLSEHEIRRIEWRSMGRLARGKLTILDGDPGLGKSTLLTDWAARVSRGDSLPDGTSQPERGVILLSAEDDPSDTIRPRLEMAGGDSDNILMLNEIPMLDAKGDPMLYPNGDAKTRMFGLPDDIAILEDAIGHMNAGLVILDPLVAYLSPDVKSNSDQDVRRALSPLSLVAQRTGVSVILVRHLNKSGGVNALYRGGGSIGIIGLARIGLLLGRSRNDPTMRVLAGVKNNIGPTPPSLGFKLESVPDSDVAQMNYIGVVPDTATQLLLGEVEDKADADEEDECTDWMRDYLSAGPREKTDIIKNARARGFSERAVKRSKAALNLKSSPGQFGGAWIWEMVKSYGVSMNGAHPPTDNNDLEF